MGGGSGGRNIMGSSMNHHSGGYGNSPSHHMTGPNNGDLRFQGTELVMLYDYKVSTILVKQAICSSFITI